MNKNAVAARKYAVFISYRHADNTEQGRQWATWLHHSLETYEVPPDLVGKPNLRGEPVPASLYPVFRDEVELPANADLSSQIKGALESSALLVVLCSPRAVASRYVAEEIRYFKELGRTDRILALMIQGEPNASDDLGKQHDGLSAALECFPEPLRYGMARSDGSVDWSARTEPIAADVRPEGRAEQGFTHSAAYAQALADSGGLSAAEIKQRTGEYEERLELAKLKVIAGALGVPLGELTQRDKAYQLEKEQKRARTLRRWLIAVFILAVLVLGAGTYAEVARRDAERQKAEAIKSKNEAVEQKRQAEDQRKEAEEQKRRADEQRNQADEQRRQAEEFIRFMAYDLKNRLETLGYQDVMDSVTAKIDAYYQSPGRLNSGEAEAWKAVRLSNEGDLLESRGELGAALDKYQASFDIARTLLEKEPANLVRQHDLAVTLLNLSGMQLAQGNTTDAFKNCQAGLALKRKLIAQDPTNAVWQGEVAASLDSYGILEANQGDLVGALQSYEEGLDILHKLVAQDPKNPIWQLYLSAILDHAGSLRKSQGDLDGALTNWQASLEIARNQAVQSPANGIWEIKISSCQNNIGQLQMTRGELAEALKNFESSMAIMRKVVAYNPKDGLRQRDLALCYDNVGVVQQAQGNLPEALTNFLSSLDITRTTLAGHDSTNVLWQRNFAVGLSHLGSVQRAQGNLSEAAKNCQASLDVISTLAEHDPTNMLLQRDRAISLGNLGDMEKVQGDAANAQHSYQKALDIVQAILQSDATNADLKNMRGQFRIQLGLDKPTLVVAQIVPGSQAERIGLHAGDVITSYAGQPVTNTSELIMLVRKAKGTQIRLEILRDGTPLDFNVSEGLLGIRAENQTVPIEP